ncbi:MAG: hypothetical protein IJ740_10420 [Ruminococcus sp.]|nr:hypothetical protein [Ruminococcus sp.]
MVDMKKADALSSLLKERSGLDVREAVVRFYSYLSNEESKTYDKEVDYLLETLGVEVELPF